MHKKCCISHAPFIISFGQGSDDILDKMKIAFFSPWSRFPVNVNGSLVESLGIAGKNMISLACIKLIIIFHIFLVFNKIKFWTELAFNF